jgi:acylpyruvate hydrolase
MQLATVRQADGTTSAARVDGDGVVLLPAADVGALLASGEGWADVARGAGPRLPLDAVRMEQLVTQPSKVICVGANYHSHLRESGLDVPTFPALFAKFTDALTGPFDDIELVPGDGGTDLMAAIGAAAGTPILEHPGTTDLVDWEAELVIVIGRTVRRADEAAAAGAIAGFTVGNDVSVRDWQLRTPQWLQGKTWEAMSPVGPVLTTVDELGVRPDLRLRCLVDDEVVQDERTSDMVFDPVDIVAYISAFVTLRPGDLIFTGSPGGVGIGRTPPMYLRPGQTLTSELEGVGQSVNKFVLAAGASPSPADLTGSGAER